MEPDPIDVAVIGAGPAGMAAAITTAASGASTAILDEQATAGGQIYRDVLSANSRRFQILGPDYAAGRGLVKRFTKSDVRHEAGAAVWEITRELTVRYLKQGAFQSLQAKRIIIANGAMERPFPIPGWTLPGVLTVGAAQILLKSAGTVPAEPVVLAGCGPLLYLLGAQYLRAGVRIAAIVDTTSPADYRRGIRHLGGAIGSPGYLKKGIGLLCSIGKSGVPHHSGATNLRVEGTSAARAFCFASGGVEHRIPASVILLHQGVVPNTQFTWALRATHHWDDAQICWIPVVDEWGELDIAGVFVAGDGRGIGGSDASSLQGTLAGLAVASQLGRLSPDELARKSAPFRAKLRRNLRIRPFLDALYRPKENNRLPADPVVICRCENVTAGDIRKYVDLGCLGPNQTKAFGRCGMGACQGRLCGLTVTELIAQRRGVSPSEVGYYRIRPPIKPVTLGELAGTGGSA